MPMNTKERPTASQPTASPSRLRQAGTGRPTCPAERHRPGQRLAHVDHLKLLLEQRREGVSRPVLEVAGRVAKVAPVLPTGQIDAPPERFRGTLTIRCGRANCFRIANAGRDRARARGPRSSPQAPRRREPGPNCTVREPRTAPPNPRPRHAGGLRRSLPTTDRCPARPALGGEQAAEVTLATAYFVDVVSPGAAHQGLQSVKETSDQGTGHRIARTVLGMTLPATTGSVRGAVREVMPWLRGGLFGI